jgi:hypothetical protein
MTGAWRPGWCCGRGPSRTRERSNGAFSYAAVHEENTRFTRWPQPRGNILSKSRCSHAVAFSDSLPLKRLL